jgi:NAD(P)-dependent dehydrogenase (short-subunit alcohol dehydrogenase family)
VRLGRAIALALAGGGHDVAIGYHRSAREAGGTVRAIRALGARGVAIRADLARPAQAVRLVEQAARALGGLDVLVNSAAVFFRTPLGRTEAADWDRLLDVNLKGAFFCGQAAARVMQRRGGHIVNVGDAGADRAWPGYIPYVVSKAGIVALTHGLAQALRPVGIAVNCVAPGAVLRPVGFPRARWRRVAGAAPPSAADVAAAVLYFATCPPAVTGQLLRVEGGGAAGPPRAGLSGRGRDRTRRSG